MLNDESRPSWPAVSVCILTANRTALLQRLLDALIGQLQTCDEVVILDTDPSVTNEDLACQYNSLQLQYHAMKMEPFDFATARNALLCKATKDVAVFLDDDAIPFADWLNQVRHNLRHLEAAGGVTVSSAQLPDWWDPAINWCIGLSPPGTVLREPGFYPDTCNLGATTKLWRHHPFKIVSRESNELYATGREDAEWWMERRIEGANVAVNYRQAVVHEIHPDRLTWKYVCTRAQLDGVSSWLRRPHIEKASAIPWDLAHIAGVVLDKIILHPFQRKAWVNDYIWLNRQWGVFRTVWKSPVTTRPRHRQLLTELGKATVFQGKIRAGNTVFNIIKRSRWRSDFPSSTPRKLFVSADCLLGDSVLLRPHLDTLARTFANAEVIVSARNPQLLAGLKDNIRILPTPQASEYTNRNIQDISAAFVPYFYNGDYRLWRRQLAQIGSTFTCDVGFTGRRDYIYARRQIDKNLELHEHENLARLFRLWPLLKTQFPAGPPVADEHLNWAANAVHGSKNGGKYIVVQFGAGYASKEWPLDCWLPFLKLFAAKAQVPIVFIGTDNWADAGNTAVQDIDNIVPCMNYVGKTTLEQLMALVHSATFFIGGCSGPKHLAMDYRVPTYTLYTATEPHRWGAVRDHELHAYVTALPQKLTGMELHGLRDDHRPRLLDPGNVAEQALRHYFNVMRRDSIAPSDAPPAV